MLTRELERRAGALYRGDADEAAVEEVEERLDSVARAIRRTTAARRHLG